MKHLLLGAAALSVAACAFAGGDKDGTKGKTPTEVKCAVMSDHKVKIASATKDKQYADYKGNRYFFCCAGCKPQFEKDPAKFAKADHIPVPKEAKGDKKDK